MELWAHLYDNVPDFSPERHPLFSSLHPVPLGVVGVIWVACGDCSKPVKNFARQPDASLKFTSPLVLVSSSYVLKGGLQSALSLNWALTQQKVWGMERRGCAQRPCSVLYTAVISLLQRGSGDGVIWSSAIRALKVGMPPDHLAPLSAYAGWSAQTLYQTLSAERMLPKTTQTTAVGVHSAKFFLPLSKRSFFSKSWNRYLCCHSDFNDTELPLVILQLCVIKPLPPCEVIQ